MSSSPEKQIEEAGKLFDNEDYAACIDCIKQNELLAKEGKFTIEQLEYLYFLLADSLFFSEKYEDAVPFYEKSIALLEHMPGQEAKTLQRLTDLGHAWSWTGNWETAVPHYEKAFRFAEQKFGRNSEEAFNVDAFLSNAYYQIDQYENAAMAYRRILEYATANLEEADEGFRDYYSGLANSLYCANENEEALLYYEKTLGYIGRDEEDYPAALRRIISLGEDLKKEEELIPYREKLNESLEIGEETAEDLADNADKLARFYRMKKDYRNAIRFAETAYTHCQKLLGEEHSKTLRAAQYYAVLLFESGNAPEALAITENLIPIYEQEGDQEKMLINLYYNSGVFSHRLKKYNKAGAFLAKALGISHKINGELSDESIRIVVWLADVYYRQGKEEKSVEFLKPCLENYKKAEAPNRLLLAQMQKAAADACYYSPGRTKEAMEYYREALEYYSHEEGAKSINALNICNQLALIMYSKLQNYKEAIIHFKDWLNDARGIYAEDHWRMLDTRFTLAFSYFREKNYTESEKAAKLLMDKLQQIDKTKKLTDSQQINKLDALQLMGTIALKTDGKEKARPYIFEAWDLCKTYCKKGDKREKTLKQLMLVLGDEKLPGQDMDHEAEKKIYFDFIESELNEPASKRRVRVFISSTFRDMMGEREHLIKNVFPKLKTQCRELGIDFSEVDLRWGVTEDDAKQGKVIEICLDEIDRSRPYFIGILGERYGWVPTLESFGNFERVLHNYEWLKGDLEHGLSITEMEIQYGVLRNPAMKGHAFFYLRDEKLTPGKEYREKEGSTEQQKLKQLKQILRQQDEYPVRDFDAIEKLGEMIYEDLSKSVFDEEDLKIKEDSPEQKLRDQLEYIKLLTDFYIPDRKLTNRVNELLKKTNRFLLTGDHGSGKTAFLANWIAGFGENPSGDVPVFYFPDASGGSKNFRLVLEEMLAQLNRIFPGLPDFQSHHPNPAHALSEVLNAIPASEKVYLIIDGVERLKQMEFFGPLFWIPPALPANIKLVFTTNSKNIQEVLTEKGFVIETVPSLKENLQKSFINDYLLKYGKKLPADVVKKIVSHPLSDNSLAIKVLLDELRIFGRHEELRQHLDFYLEAGNTVDLFEKLLQRLENDYEASAEGVVRKSLSHLAVSHKGLTEEELLEVCELAPLFWFPVYSALENYILRNNGLLSIHNISLETAIRKRYIAGDKEKVLLHSRLADYFADAGTQRKQDEYAWHLWHARRKEELKKYTTRIPVLLYFYSNDPFEFLNYFDDLAGEYDMLAELQQAVEQFEQQEQDENVLLEGLSKIISLLGNHTDPQKLNWFRDKQAALAKVKGSDSEIERAETLLKQGELAVSNKQSREAEDYFNKALQILNRNPGYKPVRKMQALMGIAGVYQQEGRWDESCQKASEAMEFAREKMGEDNLALITIYDHLAKVENARGNKSAGIKMVDKGMQIAFDYAGKEHMSVAILLSTKAVLIQEMADSPNEVYQKALPLFEQAYHIQLKQFGENSVQPILSAAAVF